MDNKLKILNKHFDKIFVITLERAKDRQENIVKLMHGVDYEFFYGVDKLKLNIETLKKENIYNEALAKKYHRNNKPMVLGHIACSYSHKKLYEKIAASNYEKVLIFEDDFLVDEKALESLDDIMNELPKSFDLLYLGYYLNEITTTKMLWKQRYYKVLAVLRLIKYKPKQIDNLYAKPFSNHLDKAGFHNTTHAYAVSKKNIHKFIDAQTPIAFNADSLLTHLVLTGKIEAYISKPKVFLQEIFVNNMQGKSYITEYPIQSKTTFLTVNK